MFFIKDAAHKITKGVAIANKVLRQARKAKQVTAEDIIRIVVKEAPSGGELIPKEDLVDLLRRNRKAFFKGKAAIVD